MNYHYEIRKSEKMLLTREKKNRTDYYSIALYPTLFDDFLLVCHCGKRACMRKGARIYFDTKREALLHSLNIMDDKKQEGYRLRQKNRSTQKAQKR